MMRGLPKDKFSTIMSEAVLVTSGIKTIAIARHVRSAIWEF